MILLMLSTRNTPQPGGDLPRCQREALRLLRELPSGKATGADIMV